MVDRRAEVAASLIGARVRRIGGDDIGTVVEVAERPSRHTTTGQAVHVEMRIRVQWARRRSWLAVSAEGSGWERAAALEGTDV